VTKNDVLMAGAAGASSSASTPSWRTASRPLAKHHGVRIETFDIIYELGDKVREMMADLLDPTSRKSSSAAPRCAQVFPLAKGFVAGCLVTEGKINRNASARLRRGRRSSTRARSARSSASRTTPTRCAPAWSAASSSMISTATRSGDVIEVLRVQKVALLKSLSQVPVNHYTKFAGRFAVLLHELQGRQAVVIGHQRPDGDCIGSQVGLCRVLRSQGIDAVCMNPDPVPRRIKFLIGDTPFFQRDELPPGDRLALFTDCADHGRAGEKVKALYPAPQACFDHHVSNVGFAKRNFVDTGSAATAEVLAGVFLDADIAFDATTAQALYTGIITDTGQFRFPSTSKRSFSNSAPSWSPAAPAQRGRATSSSSANRVGKLKLLEHYLSSLKFECEGRACIGTLPAGVFDETGSHDRGHRGPGGLRPFHRRRRGGRADRGAHRRHDEGEPARHPQLLPHGHGRQRIQWRRPRQCAAGLNYPATLAGFYPQLVAPLSRQIAEVDAHPRPAMSLQPKEIEGVLLVDKPTGLTSHDVVYRLRRKLQMKRIGHAGTLDPMATGVLIMLIGKATRISQYLISVDKSYEGDHELGVITDSQDAEGEVMETRPVPRVDGGGVARGHARPSWATSTRCPRCTPPSRWTACPSTRVPARARWLSASRASSA
jgi:phosphoesterase RecJ-like protein